MSSIIYNSGLNTGRKAMKMRNKLRIVFLFCMITVLSLGCIESQKLPSPNETATPAISAPEQKLLTYNETKPLRINDTFETWSRGYWSNLSYKQTYFRIITNYSVWTAFLDEQNYHRKLEGTLFPGINTFPKTIEPEDLNEHFIIAAMMGWQPITEGPEIEIKTISRLNDAVNVTVHMYKPSSGGSVVSAPYHIVIVKKEVLPRGNSTFIFTDTEGKELGKLEVNE